MRCNFVRIRRGRGQLCFGRMCAAYAIVTIVVLTPTTHLLAQSSLSNIQQPPQPLKPTSSTALPSAQGKPVHTYVNELADMARAGRVDAMREVAHQMYSNNGIPPEIPDSFGFTDRIVKAEAAYLNGEHAAVHEADIVKAVNNLANAVGAPSWIQTNQTEVRKVRMALLVTYPRLIGSQEPPDADGKYKALSDKIRPDEAVYTAIALLFQKHHNADYQFTDDEKAQNAKLDAATVKAKHQERTRTFTNLVGGHSNSASMVDIMAATDRFLDDLGIGQIPNTGVVDFPIVDSLASLKGAR
jgi:hypothetical protein